MEGTLDSLSGKVSICHTVAWDLSLSDMGQPPNGSLYPYFKNEALQLDMSQGSPRVGTDGHFGQLFWFWVPVFFVLEPFFLHKKG